MPLSPNSKLGPYEIKSTLGVGGMGEVYRARDSRLNRDVAIKVLRQDSAPGSSGASADLRSRFEREARAVAALNHPNIIAWQTGHHTRYRAATGTLFRHQPAALDEFTAGA